MKNHKFCPICRCNLSSKQINEVTRIACPKCGWIHYANPLPSAVAFIMNDDEEILLVKRGIKPGKGRWALPSGFIEENETAEETVLRELREETGIKGTPIDLIGVYNERTSYYGNVLLIAYRIAQRGGSLYPGTDATDARFFSLNKLPKIPFKGHRTIIKDGIARSTASDLRITVLKSKITEAIITHSKLHYKGSMGIDGAVMKLAGILPGEKVQVLNYDNGERLETYTIEEKHGSRKMVLYGPASRKGNVGEKICILAYANMRCNDAKKHRAKVITLDSKNRIKRR
ncbi:MAG: aspartate 1-decarboxylase [candidate division WOR-3 bacterium]|nr:MAG: aspartate 1-decarboxylase [candidate division WOR-3 bacterium]